MDDRSENIGGDKDAVKCNNCGTVSLIEPGGEECPSCHFVGGLAWATMFELNSL